MDEKIIKQRAQELCRKYCFANQYQISERNEKIIATLMKEFNISKEAATYYFLNNKDV